MDVYECLVKFGVRQPGFVISLENRVRQCLVQSDLELFSSWTGQRTWSVFVFLVSLIGEEVNYTREFWIPGFIYPSFLANGREQSGSSQPIRMCIILWSRVLWNTIAWTLSGPHAFRSCEPIRSSFLVVSLMCLMDPTLLVVCPLWWKIPNLGILVVWLILINWF